MIQSKKRVFTTLLLMKQLLDSCDAIETNVREWQQKVNELLSGLPDFKNASARIGLPKNWETHPVWVQE